LIARASGRAGAHAAALAQGAPGIRPRAFAAAGRERAAIRADLVTRSPELVEKWDRAVADAWRGEE
jgi:hypothetical protein